MSKIIRFPFGAADTQTPDYAAVLAVSVLNSKTIITPAQLTGNMTINATIDDECEAGDTILLVLTADATARTVTFGTGLTGVAYEVAISKTAVIELEHDGTGFKVKSAILVN